MELVCFTSTEKEPLFIMHQKMSPYLVSFCPQLCVCRALQQTQLSDKTFCVFASCRLYFYMNINMKAVRYPNFSTRCGHSCFCERCLSCRFKLCRHVCIDSPHARLCILSSVSQLPERPGQDLSDKLCPDSAGCAAYTCEDHRHRGNPLHLQRSLLQVSTAVMYPLMKASGGQFVLFVLQQSVGLLYR